jgi:hypothetical protein
MIEAGFCSFNYSRLDKTPANPSGRNVAHPSPHRLKQAFHRNFFFISLQYDKIATPLSPVRLRAALVRLWTDCYSFFNLFY